jgi:hypothetical protein
MAYRVDQDFESSLKKPGHQQELALFVLDVARALDLKINVELFSMIELVIHPIFEL